MKLSIKNLYKSFGEIEIFSDFSHVFNDSGIVLISGASGRGKTTLLRIISGLDTDYTGEVLKNGRLTLMFQEDRLINHITAYENVISPISKPTENDKKSAELLLKKLGLAEFSNSKISKLSGGMKRRVSLARALITKPDILLLDEPFTGLDKDSAETCAKVIYEFSKTALVIIVSHTDDLILDVCDYNLQL